MMETTATTMPEWERGLMLSREEFDKEMRESREEYERRRKESDEKFDKRMKERDEKFDKRMEKSEEEFKKRAEKSEEELKKRVEKTEEIFNKLFGNMGNRIGEFLEEMVEPNLLSKFQALGFKVERASRHIKYRREDGSLLAEIDILLEDGDKALVVEVKSKPSNTDIKDMVKRMEVIRTCADARNDKRKYLGAFGAMVFDDRVRDNVLRQGLYVISPSGNTFDIHAPEGIPREW